MNNRTPWSRLLWAAAVCVVAVSGSFVLRATRMSAPQNGEQSEEHMRLIHSLDGAELFQHHCAACHGARGRGDGPVATTLKHVVPDLTLLAAHNSGIFPDARVRQVILGERI